LIYSSRRFGTGAVSFYGITAQHFGKRLTHLGAVAVLYTNKKDLLCHSGKDKESRIAELFLFSATAPVITCTAENNGCVHGLAFQNKKNQLQQAGPQHPFALEGFSA
jgi:hypothetical protein